MPRKTNTKAREAAKFNKPFVKKGPGVIVDEPKKYGIKRRFMCLTRDFNHILNDNQVYAYSLKMLRNLNIDLENEICRLNGEPNQSIPCQKQWSEISEILEEHVSNKLNEGDYIKLCENIQYIYNNYVTKNSVV